MCSQIEDCLYNQSSLTSQQPFIHASPQSSQKFNTQNSMFCEPFASKMFHTKTFLLLVIYVLHCNCSDNHVQLAKMYLDVPFVGQQLGQDVSSPVPCSDLRSSSKDSAVDHSMDDFAVACSTVSLAGQMRMYNIAIIIVHVHVVVFLVSLCTFLVRERNNFLTPSVG